MYKKKELFKHIKNEVFRNSKVYLSNENLKDILLKGSFNSIATPNELLKKLRGSELQDYVQDYKECFSGNKNFITSIGKKLHHNVEKLNSTIKDNLILSESTKEVIQILKDNTTDAALVGGAVRDSALGKEVNDFDFATSAPIDELLEIFKNKGFKVQTEGLEFLVLIVTKNKEQYEIANFRTDVYEEDINGRHPTEVQIGTAEEDAFRRDFTINSLFWDLKKEEVLDYTGQGILDILTETLRFVGKPEERIREDYIRAYRFMRFVQRGFKADPKSAKAIKSMYKEIHENSNPQRVLTEFIKSGVI
jgi:hypothetical protein